MGDFRTGKVILGIFLLFLALAGMLVYLLGPVLGGARVPLLGTATFAVAALGGAMGALLLWDGASPEARLAQAVRVPLGAWLLIIVGGLFGGLLTLRSPWSAYFFPPFHLLTYIGWAGLLYALFSLGFPRLSLGDVVLRLAYGSYVATTLGGVIELALFALLGILVFLVSALLPAGQAWWATIQQALRQPDAWADTQQLLDLLRLPPVTATLGMGLVLVAPLVEETLKSLGVLLGAVSSSSRGQFVLRGALCGLGFGLMESLVNTAMVGSGWALSTLIRTLTMGMHGLTGALMGGAWYYLVRQRQWRRALGLYALCLILHGLWNGVAFTVLLAALREMPQMVGISS